MELTKKICLDLKTTSIPRCLKATGCFLYVLTIAALADQPSKVLPLREQYRQFAVSGNGDVANGQQIFEDKEKANCKSCHKVSGEGELVGPDLSTIGDKYSRQDLIDTILDPSANISPGYSTIVIVTTEGIIHTGILKSASTEEIVLSGTDGATIKIEIDEINQRRTSQISVMPEGTEDLISKQEFMDLISYLQDLREPALEVARSIGMPDEIGVLDKTVQLNPFHLAKHCFDQPVWISEHPVLEDVFVVLEHRTTKIWLLSKKAGRDLKMLFSDLSTEVSDGPWEGLVCIAFHPNFHQNRRYYLKHEMMEEGQRYTIVVEKLASENFLSDSGRASRQLLRIEQPADNHNGGTLLFGPDGYLYIGMGDGGPQEDPLGHSQNLGQLLGKILRIDVDQYNANHQYGIPDDNPFSDSSDPEIRREIWAVGLREPWRMSFDPLTGDLWAGDVGQVRFEEVTIIRSGENHGWNIYEGFEIFSSRYRQDETTYVSPIFTYGRKYGVSITGGYVYRGNRQSSFYGAYIFGDFESRRIWALTQDQRRLTRIRQIGQASTRIASFGVDRHGEIYLVGYDNGTIYHLDLSSTHFE